MGSEMDSKLAGVTAGVRADLALKRTLVGMDALVFIQAAALSGCIVAMFALVGFQPTVGSHVHFELVFAAEALTAHFTLMGLVTCVGS